MLKKMLLFFSFTLLSFHLGAGNLLKEDILDAGAILNDLSKTKYDGFYDPTFKKRPSQCPLQSDENIDIVTKLQELVVKLSGSQCSQKMQADFSYIQDLSKGTSGGLLNFMGNEYYKLYSTQWGLPATTTPTEAPPLPGSVVPSPLGMALTSALSPTDITRVLNMIQAFSNQKECIQEIHLRDLIPLMASIITRASQMALMVPSPQALGVALGGMGVGIGLTAIYAILQSYQQVDWRLYNERNSFVKLMCSFYDIRKQLSDSYVFKLNDETLLESLEKKKKEKVNIDLDVKLYSDKFKGFQDKVSEHQKAILEADLLWGKQSEALITELEKVVTILTSTQTPLEKVEKIFLPAKTIDHLFKEQRGAIPYSYAFEKEFLLFIKKFKKSTLIVDLSSYTDEKINEKLIRPFIVLSQSYLFELKKIRELVVKKWFETVIDEQSGETNKTVVEKGTKSYVDIITFLDNRKKTIDSSIALIEKISQRQKFTAYDKGDINDYDILDQFDRLQKEIYSDKGYPFVRYLLNDSLKQQKLFSKHYDEFYKKWQTEKLRISRMGNDPKDLNPAQRQEICRLGYNLYIKWSKAQSSMEVVYDFLQTNVAIIAPYSKLLKRFWFIPLPWPSYELRLRLQLDSMNEIERLVREKNSSVWDHFLLNRYGITNIGKAIDFSYITKHKVLVIENFLIDPDFKCSEFLNH